MAAAISAEQGIGAVADEPRQEIPLGNRDAAQKWAVAEHRGKQSLPAGVCAPGAGERGAALVRGRGERFLPGREAEREKPCIGGFGQPVTVSGEMR